MCVEYPQEDDKLGSVLPIDLTMGVLLCRGSLSYEIKKGTIKPFYSLPSSVISGKNNLIIQSLDVD